MSSAGHNARKSDGQLQFDWLPDQPMLRVADVVAATGMQTTYVEEYFAEKCHRYPSKTNARPAMRIPRAFAVEPAREPADADAALYDGFPSEADKRLFPQVRSAPPARLAEFGPRFDDPRFAELLFRYRARNWPATLSADERARWDDYRRTRFSTPPLGEYDFTAYYAEIATLRASEGPGPKQAWLDALESWGHDLERSLA